MIVYNGEDMSKYSWRSTQVLLVQRLLEYAPP